MKSRWGPVQPHQALAALAGVAAGPAYDRAAALVLQADSLNRPPEVALRWAETILDPDLRQKSLVPALTEMAGKNSAAALAYVQRSPDFTPDQRTQIERQFSGQ